MTGPPTQTRKHKSGLEIECAKHRSGIQLVTVVADQRLDGGDTHKTSGKVKIKINHPGEAKKNLQKTRDQTLPHGGLQQTGKRQLNEQVF